LEEMPGALLRQYCMSQRLFFHYDACVSAIGAALLMRGEQTTLVATDIAGGVFSRQWHLALYEYWPCALRMRSQDIEVIVVQERRLTRGRQIGGSQCLILIGLLGLAAVLGSCAPLASAPPAPSRASFAQALLNGVAAAAVGSTQELTDPATRRTVRLSVISAYNSASGRPCRQYVVIEMGEVPQRHLACADAAGWVEVRPLIVNAGSALVAPTP
jgi:hypothetical protein